MNTTFKKTLSAASLLLVLTAFGCQDPPKQTEEAFNRVEFYTGDSATALTAVQGLIADIDKAQTTIDIAMERFTTTAISDALIRAQGRGVVVRFVGDEDFAADPGHQALQAAGVQMSLGDGELKYLPEPTITTLLEVCRDAPSRLDQSRAQYIQCTRGQRGRAPQPDDGLMVRPGYMNTMSNNFAVIDGITTYNFGAPDLSDSNIFFGWRMHSQDMAIAFTREFQQMFAGVYAVTLDIYNGPVKSTVHGAVYDSRLPSDRPGRTRQLLEGYLTDRGLMSVHFNPQQRLTKEMIDELYRAKGSVSMMTNEVTNDYVIDALAYKSRYFNVQLIVNANAIIPERLAATQVDIRRAPASVGYVPTVVVTNIFDGKGGVEWPRTVITMSHSFLGGPPFQVFDPRDLGEQEENDIVRVLPSDVFVDGNMWLMREPIKAGGGAASVPDDNKSVFDDFESFWSRTWNNATEAQ